MFFVVRQIETSEKISLTGNYNPDEDFSVYFTATTNNVEYNLEWWRNHNSNENSFYIALPSGVDVSDTRINFTARDEITVNGKVYYNGDTLPLREKYSIYDGENEYTLRPMELSDLYSLHIVTDDGYIELEDKEIKKPGYMVLMNDESVLYSGKLDYIKGRGNSSWHRPKKSFAISTRENSNFYGGGGTLINGYCYLLPMTRHC